MKPTVPAAAVAADPFPTLPHRFGQYELRERIGGGGFGVVYKAHHALLDGVYAVKVPRSGSGCSAEERDLILREYVTVFRLQSAPAPGTDARLCRVVDGNTVAGCPYFAMEYLNGPTLDAYWDAERERLGPGGPADLVGRVARLMAGIHKGRPGTESVVHLDLKPPNIIACPQPGGARPALVVFDFGQALAIDPAAPPRGGAGFGTFGFMPPEQLMPGWRGHAVSPLADVYALGAVLYTLLTGRTPTDAATYDEAVVELLNGDPAPPGDTDPQYRRYDEVCRRALARDPGDRYQSMDEFADALAGTTLDAQLAGAAGAGGVPVSATLRPAVPARDVRYAFVPYGYVAPDGLAGRDRLFLDVGNRLAAGVIDHHHRRGTGPTAKMVGEHATFIDAAVARDRGPDAPFTVVLHDYPDLDAVASTFLAVEYLANRVPPTGANALVEYVARGDAGELRLDPERPFALHVAFARLAARSLALGGMGERNQSIVRDGIQLIEFALRESARTGVALADLDAFAAPVFGPEDRAAVLADRARYRAKLKNPASRAGRYRFRLAGRDGFEKVVEGLLVRDVMNPGDPERVAYFKDWARGDTGGSLGGAGFAVLSVFVSADAMHPRRCILSVTPQCGASLEGLGKRLDEAEAERRKAAFGVDNRVTDPATGDSLPVRKGFSNADPWYDGSGHDFTIVDSPRTGTLLAADEIERIFREFGHASELGPVPDVNDPAPG